MSILESLWEKIPLVNQLYHLNIKLNRIITKLGWIETKLDEIQKEQEKYKRKEIHMEWGNPKVD